MPIKPLKHLNLSFVHACLSRHQAGDTAALPELIAHIEGLLKDRRYRVVRAILNSIDVNQSKPVLLTSLARVVWEKDALVDYEGFYERIYKRLHEVTGNTRLLDPLQPLTRQHR